ncbi:MAG: IS200/IS605 family transposase [Pyrinomonadaceae bacterium]
MPQSLSQIYIHLVFSTKNREPLIHDEIAPELYAYMAVVLHDECKSPAKLIGGVEDHLHILFNLSRTWAIANVVESIKTSTSKWMKTKDSNLRSFGWQTGYGAFSVSRSNLDSVSKYILDQKEHHRQLRFRDEFRGLLDKHEVEYDEKYVWD